MNLYELSDDDLLALAEGCTVLQATEFPHTCLGCEAAAVWRSRDNSRTIVGGPYN